ncbi:unnamed protein product [Lepeophtheirus salmonis]|uniref:(salmon louse) hypothetical protein n=1 Tax=Lepeophtheirus salmonis TaxID=72036 RepID=A0A7R8D7N0_LEPSM|nr:transmembrane protein 209-like [Lepeophtheirus salmonis]CAB4068099.1 unnamed protein product [Lepeophtheirus salmonis]CAF3001519.1 unnamed protein product [Lepeophtheirus salmonis]
MLFEGFPILETALDRIVHLEKCSRGIGMAAIQIPISIVLFLDSQFGFLVPGHDVFLVSYLESFIALLVLTQGLLNAFSYVFPMFRREKIPLTSGQMTRLGLRPTSPGFKLMSSPLKKINSPPTFSPLEGSFILKGGHLESSMNTSLNSSSWIYQSFNTQSNSSPTKDTKEEQSGKRRPNDFKRAHFNNTSHNSSINDDKSLTEYLKDFETWEKSQSFLSTNNDVSTVSGGNSSFWKSSSASSPVGTNNGLDYSPILKKYTYQLATQPPTKCGGNCSSPGNATVLHHTDSCNNLGNIGAMKSNNPGSSPSSTTIRKETTNASSELRVDPLRLVQMTQNLRMWISQTVLSRIVKEIDSTNKALSRLGLSDCRIGELGLEKIKKNSLFHFNNIPSLSSLVPFLEVSTNQEYLVGRLRELCKGGAMGTYRWNGGGRFRGTDWNDKFVTDAEIVMHCVACYLDSRLPPNYDYIEGDGRAFSSIYYFKSPEKPDIKKSSVSVAIVQSPQKPPYYYLQFIDKILEVEPGRNNLFHILLMFMHHIKTKENGMVGRINFGLTGVNILWVLES